MKKSAISGLQMQLFQSMLRSRVLTKVEILEDGIGVRTGDLVTLTNKMNLGPVRLWVNFDCYPRRVGMRMARGYHWYEEAGPAVSRICLGDATQRVVLLHKKRRWAEVIMAIINLLRTEGTHGWDWRRRQRLAAHKKALAAAKAAKK